MNIKSIYDLILYRWHKRKYKTFESLEFISVWNFFKVIETNDLRYIFKLKTYSSLPNIKYTPINEWLKLQDDYSKSLADKSLYLYQIARNELYHLRVNYFILTYAIPVLFTKENIEIIELIRKRGYKFNYSNEQEYLDIIMNLRSQCIGLGKKIEFKSSEIEEKYKSKEVNKVDIYKVIGILETYKGRKIDIFTTSMKEFVTIQNGYKEWAKAQEENGRR